MFKEYQMVRLKRPMGGLAAGTLGAVVTAYSGLPPGYEVEFCDDQGFTLALLTLDDQDLAADAEAEWGPRLAPQ